MTLICLSAACRRIFSPAPILAVTGLLVSGCAAMQPGTARSSIPRENALMLAQQTADCVKGRVFTIAPTGSMKPTLDENSVVTVETVAFSQLRKGDIVIYRNSSGVPIVHRLHGLNSRGWIVLGDNNDTTDREAVTESNFVGRVCAIFYTTPGVGYPDSTAIAQR
jgi:signal peptidase I